MWNSVTTAEAVLTELAIQELRDVPWAKPLLAQLIPGLDIRHQDRSLLFEIRFAHALHQQGNEAQYEFGTGVETSTVDFRVITPDAEWLIELVSLSESQAVKNATNVSGPFQQISLVSGCIDMPESEEGEVIKAQERIVEKVFSKGKPTKFPLPSKSIHAIVTDMRGYLGIGKFLADSDDYKEISYGHTAISDHCVHFWNNEPIKGLFEPPIRLKEHHAYRNASICLVSLRSVLMPNPK